MLQILANVDHILLCIIIRSEYSQQRLLRLIKASLLNTENIQQVGGENILGLNPRKHSAKSEWD